MKSYAVLFAPEFRLQATVRHQPEWAVEPLALVDARENKPVVVEMNQLARAHRVEGGMTPTQALARCPHLRLLAPNAGHERSAQETMLQLGETLSPFLESTAPGVVTLELPAERGFLEGELTQRLVLPLRSLGLDVRVGVAVTPDLALLAARLANPVRIVAATRDFLSPLPVTALEPAGEIASVLDSWGIHTIGQFLALPAAETWARLGPEAVALSERAEGGHPRPLRLVQPPASFAESADLDHPVETLEPLLFLLRRFLEKLTARLACAWLVAGRLRLELRFEYDPPYRRVFAIPQPTRDVDLLFRLLHTHLENFTSPSALVGLELVARPARPQAQQIGLLDRGLRDPHQFVEMLARLQALPGTGEVGSPQLVSSHHTDAFALQPHDVEAASVAGSPREILLGVPWLRFRPPLPAHVTMDRATPAYIHSPSTTGPVREAHGPWLLTGSWWEEAPSWSREEWDIATDEGFFRLVQSDACWFLEGIYA